MLVLTLKTGGFVQIGDNVRVYLKTIGKGQVQLAFDAPPSVTILRDKVIERQSQGE